MGKWHESLTARIGLRIAGFVLLALAWVAGHGLAHLVHTGALDDASPTEFFVGALLFTSGTAGSALLIFGSGLWKDVQVAERWVQRDSRSRH